MNAVSDAPSDSGDMSALLSDPDPTPATSEPDAPAPPKPKPSSRRKTYEVQPGDHPSLIAKKVYGRAGMGRELVQANPGASWAPGTHIKLV